MEEEAEHLAPRHLIAGGAQAEGAESLEAQTGVTREITKILVAGYQPDIVVQAGLRNKGIRHARLAPEAQ